MVIRKFYAKREDGVRLFKSYSDNGYMIKQIPTGTLYSEAIDVDDAPFVYVETNILIEPEEVVEEKGQ